MPSTPKTKPRRLHPLVAELAGTDRRSIGDSNAVVRKVLAKPDQFGAIIVGMADPDPVIRMRCADAAEKVTAERPDLLSPYKRLLLSRIAQIDQQEVRWHFAQMIPRVKLSTSEQRAVERVLMQFLQDKSAIVRTFSMQALAELAAGDPTRRADLVPIMKKMIRTGTPAVKSRGKKLLLLLQSETAAR